MQLREQIESVFEGRAFRRPLFYSYPGGLRFALSEGGSLIDQLLVAIRKASEVCDDIFQPDRPVTVCLRDRAVVSRFMYRNMLRELQSAGITVPARRSLWSESVAPGDRLDAQREEYWISLGFELPVSSMRSILWCALVKDLAPIRPNPLDSCSIYLLDVKRAVLVLPYDDRGMDVVGPNHDLLACLYRRHQRYLLDHDMPAMRATFG